MSDTIEQLALKLSILKQGVEASLTKIKIHEFKMATRDCIALGHRHVNKFNDNEYHNEYNQIAFNILSCSPFNTQVHVCGALRCTQDTFMEWHSIHENFREAVKHGFVNGEMLARELLVEFSFEPSNKVNTNLIKILSNNVYKIEEQLPELKVPININTDPEKELKERGIPIPEIAIEDVKV